MSQKQCLLFAGQSVQEAGMGKELLKIPQSREIILRLKPFLGQDLEYLLTEMPDSELALTFNAQRAIFAPLQCFGRFTRPLVSRSGSS